jgi:hypothetical protein
MVWRARSARAAFVPRQGGSYAQIQRLGGEAEQLAGMPGFAAFALGVATRESGGDNMQSNTSASEAAAAARGYDRNRDGIFRDNPYPRQRFVFGSGGWFGLLPSTALSFDGWHNADPYLVFDPTASVAMFANFVRKVVLGHFSKIPPEHRNWLTIRRFMSSNAHGLDWREELEKSPRIRERFAGDLAKRGIDPSFMFEPVRIEHWPGNVAIYQQLRMLEHSAGGGVS